MLLLIYFWNDKQCYLKLVEGGHHHLRKQLWKPLKLLSEIPVLYLLRISIHTSIAEPINDLSLSDRTLK